MAGIANLIAAIEADLLVAYPQLQRGFGTRELDRQSSPPRIVWVVLSAGHTPPAKIGRPRSLLTRQVEVVVHVWGASLGQLETLVEDVIAATHKHAHGSVLFGGEQWITDDDVHRGMAALLRITLDGPVLERRFKTSDRDADTKLTTAKITTIDADTSTSAPGDGAIDWKE